MQVSQTRQDNVATFTVGVLHDAVQMFSPHNAYATHYVCASTAMTSRIAQLLRPIADIKTTIAFLTRIPIGDIGDGATITRAIWAVPIAGLVVGAIAACVYAATSALGLPTLPAAALTVGATLFVTGALHEDGLADTADGFGGGATRARKLEIMHDSRVGTYGACALMMSLLLRAAALASIAEPVHAAYALIAAHVAARATLPVFMRLVPPARSDGLSADAGRPSSTSAATAALLGIAALAVSFTLAKAGAALVWIVLVMFVMARLCRKQIGGQTGDTLGALEQMVEISILLCAATR